ncbi:MAG: glycosyltransferase family 4 protein [Spirochaetaceae bacterium]|jgi:glycosyltransferase involved in cell wall biosynthesis|nr:glycosyltransferase family 4 protein [Spirochaetaceae bacterium]
MKIGIDTFACEGGKTAIGIYLTQLLKRIPPSGDHFELFGWNSDRFTYAVDAPDLEYISRCRISGRAANSLWHIARYPRFARARSYDGCFFPAAHKQIPSRSPCPTVGVVHDMAAYWGSRKTRESAGAVIRMILPNALRRLDRIIAVSSWVKQELIDLVKVRESSIEVVPNGIDHGIFYPRPHNEESMLLIQPFSFRRPYILCISRIEHPVKNHIRLIQAFNLFKEQIKYPHRLVLAGPDSYHAEKVKEFAGASPFRNDIFFTGHFPMKHLPELYAGADMVVIPSLYEGFGMGALEAMSSGIPVICARAASLPETADAAALYFDPYDPADLAARMITLSTDGAAAQEYARRGLERAAAFSWDACAKQTLAIIQETAGK